MVTHYEGQAGMERVTEEHEVETATAADALGLYAPDDWPREQAPAGLCARSRRSTSWYSDDWIVTPVVSDEELEREVTA